MFFCIYDRPAGIQHIGWLQFLD